MLSGPGGIEASSCLARQAASTTIEFVLLSRQQRPRNHSFVNSKPICFLLFHPTAWISEHSLLAKSKSSRRQPSTRSPDR